MMSERKGKTQRERLWKSNTVMNWYGTKRVIGKMSAVMVMIMLEWLRYCVKSNSKCSQHCFLNFAQKKENMHEPFWGHLASATEVLQA